MQRAPKKYLLLDKIDIGKQTRSFEDGYYTGG
jgi:hypothetical protein